MALQSLLRLHKENNSILESEQVPKFHQFARIDTPYGVIDIPLVKVTQEWNHL